MKKTLSYYFLIAAFLAGAGRVATAQVITTTNLLTETKERVLRIETIVAAAPREVWKAFATEEGLKKWVAPVVALDLRTGGTLSTHYDKAARIGDPGTIRLGIVNYLDGELMTYKVTLTERFGEKARSEDQHLQEVIQIVPWTNGRTKVISSMIGWGTGKDWDDTYDFFARGNVWSYQQLAKCFSPARSAKE
ncbi:MAG: SRPBCC domain-containing protein [Verrucomicrobiota bacterium]